MHAERKARVGATDRARVAASGRSVQRAGGDFRIQRYDCGAPGLAGRRGFLRPGAASANREGVAEWALRKVGGVASIPRDWKSSRIFSILWQKKWGRRCG